MRIEKWLNDEMNISIEEAKMKERKQHQDRVNLKEGEITLECGYIKEGN